MKKGLFFIFGLIFLSVNMAAAQTKTVTNADLEKFRQKRLKAEKDYRENYARLGFPSPEELEEERVESRKELAKLSARIEKENFEREQLQRAEEYRREQETLRIIHLNSGVNYGSNAGVFYGNGFNSSFYSGAYPFYGFSSGFYYNNRFPQKGRFGRGGNFYNPVMPGTVFPPRNGVRINNNGVRISVTTGGSRFPAGIRSPR